MFIGNESCWYAGVNIELDEGALKSGGLKSFCNYEEREVCRVQS